MSIWKWNFRHSTFFKPFIEPLNHKQNPEPVYHDYNDTDEEHIIDDDPGTGNDNAEDDENERRNRNEEDNEDEEPPQPVRDARRPEPVNEQRGIRNPLAFVGRHLRSRGPAPEIPNVLQAAPEYSNTTRRELQEIHDQHERERQEAQVRNNNA